MRRLYHSPARIIKQLLVDYGLGFDPEVGTAGTSPWAIYRGREPDRPDDLIKVSDTTPRGEGDTQTDGIHQQHEGIQVFVRSADYDRGYRKINAISLALDQVNFVSVDLPAPEGEGEVPGTAEIRYEVQSCTCTSGPAPTGPDTPAGKRLTFTVNYLVSIRRCE